MDMTEFEQLLALGHEQYGVEFKGPGSLKDSRFAAKVIRAILGMANKRDGGYVIIGVDDDSTPVGLDDESLKTWQYDHLADELMKYADPFVRFDLHLVDYNGAKIVVIYVYEFDEVPVICKKDYPSILQRGGCYVRRLGKPETLHIPTQGEMRELIDMATEKKMRNFFRLMNATGLATPAFKENLFEQKMKEMKETDIIKIIQSRGYWSFVLHPQSFQPDLIKDIARLEPMIRSCSVRLRGWDFPHIGINERPKIFVDWIEHETNWWNHIEKWGFFQCGLFTYVGGYSIDWAERIDLPYYPLWEPNGSFGIIDAVYTLTEMFEFASRLLVHEEYMKVDQVRLQIVAHNLQGRQLVMEDPRRHVWGRHLAEIEKFPYDRVFLRTELISNARNLALNLADEIFKRFGLYLNRSVLTELQHLR